MTGVAELKPFAASRRHPVAPVVVWTVYTVSPYVQRRHFFLPPGISPVGDAILFETAGRPDSFRRLRALVTRPFSNSRVLVTIYVCFEQRGRLGRCGEIDAGCRDVGRPLFIVARFFGPASSSRSADSPHWSGAPRMFADLFSRRNRRWVLFSIFFIEPTLTWRTAAPGSYWRSESWIVLRQDSGDSK